MLCFNTEKVLIQTSWFCIHLLVLFKVTNSQLFNDLLGKAKNYFIIVKDKLLFTMSVAKY